jgi:ferritin-like metal-binding protein YciE
VSLANPRDLLLQQLSELLWIERTLFAEVLPALHDDAHAPELQQALTAHRAQTREHCVRLEAAIRALGAEPAAASSQALAATAEQHEREAPALTDRRLRDVFHCAGAMRTEHLELAAYDAAILLADGECRALLERNREEDADALREIERLATALRQSLEGSPET